MDWMGLFAILVITLIILFLINFLNSEQQRTILFLHNREQVLHMPKHFLSLGYFGLGLTLLYSIFVLLSQPTYYTWIDTTILLSFGLQGVICLLYYRQHQVQFNDRMIIVKTWRGEEIQCPWVNVSAFEPLAWLGQYQLQLPDKRITISTHLIGFDQFLSKLEEKRPFTR